MIKKKPAKLPPLAPWIVATKLLKAWRDPSVKQTRSRKPPDVVVRGLEYPRY